MFNTTTMVFFVVDVYCGWCGPCIAMEQHLRKLKVAHITSLDRYSCSAIDEKDSS